MKNTELLIAEVLDRVDIKSERSIQEAANTVLGLAGVTSGCKVAIIDDPTFPSAGLGGKVKSVENGIAKVELANGMVVDLLVNQLIAL